MIDLVPDILRCLEDVVWSSTVGGTKLLYINAACERLYGYTEQELCDRPLLWHESVEPEDRTQMNWLWTVPRVDGSLEECKDQRCPCQRHQVEYRIRHRDGSVRWVQNRAWLVCDTTGKGLRWDGIISDITAQRQQNQAQHQLVETLRQNEEKMLRTLERERELGDLKSRFVSMVSHEFRTPLTTIQSSAELLEYYDWSEVERKERFQQIRGAVQHMTQLLEDVLLIGKVEAGSLAFLPRPVELMEFCHELVTNFDLSCVSTASHSEHRHFFKFTSTGEPHLLCLDPKLLRQILNNLLSNAVKYSPVGSTVQLHLSYQPEHVVFRVIDQGMGIPLHDQSRLFEAFYRASNADTIQGTGLGLAIVKKCVDLHKGSIALESNIGQGTTFTVVLPLDHDCEDGNYV